MALTKAEKAKFKVAKKAFAVWFRANIDFALAVARNPNATDQEKLEALMRMSPPEHISDELFKYTDKDELAIKVGAGVPPVMAVRPGSG
jgi:hypothetical protein